ncbi:MAG: FAD synthetase family protein [Treponema sp.]|jgi:riboflavin kinase/FMN adenylyltransferase|nr:FAD synthetase family protein [Treponema sp.]
MLTIEWPQFLENGLPLEHKQQSSMTVGIFDGVHRGHQALIKRIVSHNADCGDYSDACCDAPEKKTPVVVTFRENHKTEEGTGNIQSFGQRAAMLEKLGVEILLVIDFTESFRRMNGIEFLEILLLHGNIGFFAVGSEFRCGYQQDTNAQAIRDFFVSRNIQVEIVPEVMEGSLPISSSRIRSAIANGDISLAEKMLGCSFTADKIKIF